MIAALAMNALLLLSATGPGDAGVEADAAGVDGGAADIVVGDAAPVPAKIPAVVPAPAKVSVAVAPVAAPTPAAPSYETVVTARPPDARAPREDRVAAASVVFPDESPRAFDDLGDLLVEVPGVTVVRSGGIGDFATVTLRGSNPDEVRVYIDGVPLNLAAGGGIDISTIPLGDVERIEIYRGTTPISFAESALGGIVSVVTRTPGASRLTMRAGGGSFGTMFGDASASSRAGPLRVYGGAHVLVGENGNRYVSDNGTAANPSDDYQLARANDAIAQVDGVLRALLPLGGRRELGLGLIGIARDKGLPSTSIQTTSQSRFETARGVAYLRYGSRDDLGPGGQLDARLFASLSRDRFHDPYGEISAIPALTSDTTLSVGASATASRPLASWLRAAAVIEGRRETFQPTNQLDAQPVGVPATRAVGVAGAELDLWWRRLELDVIPSARLEAIRDQVSGRDTLFERQVAAATPIDRAMPVLRLGLSRPLGARVTLKANAGRYARAPSFLELYGNDGQLLGTPALRAETGYSADLGAAYRAGDARLGFEGRTSLFGARVDDLIDWQQTQTGQARAANIDRARILGVEQDGVLVVGRHVQVALQATYLDARDTGDIAARRGHLLPLRPRLHAYGRPELRRLFERRGLSAGAFVEADLREGSFIDPANIVPQPARLLLGAGVSAELPRAGLRLVLSAKNLTDIRTSDLSGYLLPGRSVFLSLMWSSRLDETQRSDPP